MHLGSVCSSNATYLNLLYKNVESTGAKWVVLIAGKQQPRKIFFANLKDMPDWKVCTACARHCPYWNVCGSQA